MMKKKIVLFFLIAITMFACDEKNNEDQIGNLFEEPNTEWGISTSELKSKVEFPVYKEWNADRTFVLKLHGIEMIGNNPAVLEFQNTDKDVESVSYYFINDNTTLNAVKCILSKNVDYYSILGGLRDKYGIEKANNTDGLFWSANDTYICLSKPEDDLLTVTYFDIQLLEDPRPVSGIKIIDSESMTLSVGQVSSLIWQVTPSNAKYSVSIRSNAPDIVDVVNQDGRVKAQKRGKAQIIIEVVGTNISDTCFVNVTGSDYSFSFENIDPVVTDRYTYDVFYEEDAIIGNRFNWASANAGFAITGLGTKDPSSFPACAANNGKVGKCAMLQTKSTGSFGADVKMPIAAGNLFIGTFDVASALSNALKATRLGMPFEHLPTYLKGYYKYKAGDIFQESGEPVAGKKDTWDVYAIFYEVSDKVKYLDGTIVEGNFSDPSLISVALLDDKERKETDEWTEFYIPFVMKPGKIIDSNKLKKGGYNISVVFSSSKDGNYFRGAHGSTLYIDEVEIVFE